MLTREMKGQKRGSGKMLEDERILELYWARNTQAIHETSEKYGSRLSQLSTRLLRAKEDAEECVNDTYLGTWNAIPPQRPSYFFAFLAKLCRNIACNKLDWLNAAKRRAEVVELTDELAACIPNPEDERQRESRELGEALNRFLESLPQENRLIFMRRYWYMDSVHEIAARYGFGESRVKTSLFRTRQKLREYLEKEEISV